MEGKTVLEQANEVLAEAREMFKKTEENLDKSIRASDLALSKTRELARALSCLSKPMMTVAAPMSEEEDHQLLETLKKVSPKYQPVVMDGCVHGYVESPENRDVYDIIHAINVLALSNTDVLHVFVSFQAHVNLFCVRVHSAATDYQSNEPRSPLFEEGLYLDTGKPLEQLLSIESQLTELIIEAREQAKASAEVDA